MAAKTILSVRDEEILRAVYYYRYVTVLDITSQQFARASLNHAREILSRLAGNSDLDSHNYLCRFTLPAINKKPQEKVFVLGSRGRRVLQNMGLPATWYFRPHKLKFLSYSYVLHNLILTRNLIAAGVWVKEQPTFLLTDKRICL